MTASPKLLPCPFCGGKARIKPMLNMTELRIDHAAVCVMYGKRYAVAHPGATMPVNAFEAWNRRAQDPEREAMAKACEAAKARMDTYDRGEDYTGGIRSVEWDILRAALTDLELARKGEG